MSDATTKAALGVKIKECLDRAEEIQTLLDLLSLDEDNDEESDHESSSPNPPDSVKDSDKNLKIIEHVSTKFTSLMGVWQPDHEAFECSQCERKFAIWLRRHHCR